jgi:hypothetical protein
VVDDVSNGLDGEALRRWFAPNALARTLITMHSGEYGSLNKRRFGQFSESLCIAQIIPLAVSSSTPWRIYA